MRHYDDIQRNRNGRRYQNDLHHDPDDICTDAVEDPRVDLREVTTEAAFTTRTEYETMAFEQNDFFLEVCVTAGAS